MNNMLLGYATLTKIPSLSYQYNHRILIYQHDKVKLYHYSAKAKKINATPLLIVFATVNRPEILDLFPERSFIGGLLDNGVDVYLLDWGYPDLNDNNIALSDYVTHYLDVCVKFIIESSQREKINLLGICQGGLISLCYALLNHHIKKLVLISTPIDFHTKDNTITKFINKIDVNQMVSEMKNISGAWLTQFFISLRPFELIGKKYLKFVDNIANEEMTQRFLQVEKWLYDAPDQTGKSFTEFAHDYYRDNKLIKGDICMNGQRIELQRLNIPVLNVMAKNDEIIPVSASSALKKYVGSKYYTQKIFPSGHIGIYVSDRVGVKMPKAIASWLKNTY